MLRARRAQLCWCWQQQTKGHSEVPQQCPGLTLQMGAEPQGSPGHSTRLPPAPLALGSTCRVPGRKADRLPCRQFLVKCFPAFPGTQDSGTTCLPSPPHPLGGCARQAQPALWRCPWPHRAAALPTAVAKRREGDLRECSQPKPSRAQSWCECDASPGALQGAGLLCWPWKRHHLLEGSVGWCHEVPCVYAAFHWELLPSGGV